MKPFIITILFIALALPIMFAAYVLYEGKYRYFMILPTFFPYRGQERPSMW